MGINRIISWLVKRSFRIHFPLILIKKFSIEKSYIRVACSQQNCFLSITNLFAALGETQTDKGQLMACELIIKCLRLLLVNKCLN